MDSTIKKYDISGTVNGITSEEGIKEIVKVLIEKYNAGSSSIILDIGCSDGSAIDFFRKYLKAERAIGVEFIKERYDKAISNYPECEFYFNAIQERLDIVSEANIIFMNDICFPDQLLKDIYSSIKTGTILIYNKITNTLKFARNNDYDKLNDFYKIYIHANNMKSEFHITVKK